MPLVGELVNSLRLTVYTAISRSSAGLIMYHDVPPILHDYLKGSRLL